MRRHAGRGSAALVLAATLATGCSDRPALEDVEPAMAQAVRTVVGPGVDVRRALLPRCGPTDEVLDGRRVTLSAGVPPGSVDLVGVAQELRRTELEAEVGDGRQAPLLHVESRDWNADLWPSDDGAWHLTATAEMAGDGRTDPVDHGCG